MANNRYVLDTSAILTLIEDEDGADRVEQIFKKNEVIISWIALMEVVYISRQEQGEEAAMKRYAAIMKTDATILWNADEPLLLTAAHLKASHRISFADSIIAATAIQHKAILLHKDPEFETLKIQAETEALPYKAKPMPPATTGDRT